MTDLTESVLGSLQLRSDLAKSEIVSFVRQRLLQADPSSQVEATGYFNHSYFPDLVASWRGPDGLKSRPFYLRLRLESNEVREDVDRLGVDSPAIIGLLPTEDQSVSETARPSQAPTTLVAEGSALDEVAELGESSGFGAMVPSAFVRAGRGYLDEGGGGRSAGSG